MKRAYAGVFFAVLLLGASPCSSDPEADEGAGATSGSAAGVGGTSGAGATGGAGAAGTGGDGASGTTAGQSGAPSGGASGVGEAGTGAGAGAGGEPSAECELECEDDQHCELRVVECFAAPCPAQPTCVDDGAGGQACGGRGTGPCPDGQFCDFPIGADCGRSDAQGTCAIVPDACDAQYEPVCGCDGEDYGNACTANSAGVSVESEGECGAAIDPNELFDCKLDAIGCDSLPPECPEGETPSQNGLCYGPCVPIEQCECAGPSDCPDEDHYTCHMSAGHCGPYV